MHRFWGLKHGGNGADCCEVKNGGPPLWSSAQTSWLQTQRSRVRFPVLQWVWNGVHSALVRINEEILERKVVALV
jgi:hypothetical protein